MMQTGNRYADRRNAGQALAARLSPLAGQSNVVVIGVPPGGVLVAAEVAEALGAGLDVFPVRRLNVPGEPEVAIGALGLGGVQVLDERLMTERNLSPADLAEEVAAATRELARQEQHYRRFRPAPPLAGRIVIVVDDGAATGYALVAAVAGVRARDPNAVVVAVPVASEEACVQIMGIADQLLCPLKPSPFHAVGLWYVHYEAVTEEEAGMHLAAAGTKGGRSGGPPA